MTTNMRGIQALIILCVLFNTAHASGTESDKLMMSLYKIVKVTDYETMFSHFPFVDNGDTTSQNIQESIRVRDIATDTDIPGIRDRKLDVKFGIYEIGLNVELNKNSFILVLNEGKATLYNYNESDIPYVIRHVIGIWRSQDKLVSNRKLFDIVRGLWRFGDGSYRPNIPIIRGGFYPYESKDSIMYIGDLNDKVRDDNLDKQEVVSVVSYANRCVAIQTICNDTAWQILNCRTGKYCAADEPMANNGLYKLYKLQPGADSDYEHSYFLFIDDERNYLLRDYYHNAVSLLDRIDNIYKTHNDGEPEDCYLNVLKNCMLGNHSWDWNVHDRKTRMYRGLRLWYTRPNNAAKAFEIMEGAPHVAVFDE